MYEEQTYCPQTVLVLKNTSTVVLIGFEKPLIKISLHQ